MWSARKFEYGVKLYFCFVITNSQRKNYHSDLKRKQWHQSTFENFKSVLPKTFKLKNPVAGTGFFNLWYSLFI